MGIKGQKFMYIPEVKRLPNGTWRMQCKICHSCAIYNDHYQALKFAIIHKPICGKVVS